MISSSQMVQSAILENPNDPFISFHLSTESLYGSGALHYHTLELSLLAVNQQSENNKLD
jgi:hypothetical protein